MFKKISQASMSQAFISSIGNPDHYQAAVSQNGMAPIVKQDIANYLTQDQSEKLLGNRVRAYAFGNLSTTRNERIVEKMVPGDRIVFYGQKMLLSAGRIVQVVISEELADYLFGDRRFKFIVFIDDFKELNSPAKHMTKHLYGNEYGVVRSLRRLNEENSRKLEELLD